MTSITNSADQGTSTAVPSSETNVPAPRELATQLRYEFKNRTQDILEQECRYLEQNQTTVTDAMELGKCLLFLKESSGRGNWLPTLQRVGISASIAARLMAVFVRIFSLPNAMCLVTAAKSKTKLFELLVLDDEELEHLIQGESVRGVSLSTLPQNSVATLRSMLRDNAPKKAAQEAALTEAKSLLSGQRTPVAPPTADTLVSEAQADQPLQSGDRVGSLHAGRLGRVVRTYADGSACICWDDGEPQPEGLGHERMPRQLLIRTGQEPAAADSLIGDAAEVTTSGQATASASRHVWEAATDTPVTDTRATCAAMLKENIRMPNKLMLSDHTLASLAVNPEVRSYLPIHQHGPATLGQLQIILGITEIEVNDAVKTPILTYDRSTFELYGEAEPTPAPFSGNVDPGKGRSAAQNESVAPAENIEVLPSIFSMARGEFANMEVTLMIHAGKTWMIAEEIAAVLGKTPEEVKKVEGFVDQLFVRQTAPGAYAKVRVASMALAARLLDAQAIELLALQLNTPAAYAFADWMNEMSSPGEGWTPAEDEPGAQPLNDCPTLAQKFEELGTLHNMAWKMLSRVSNQINALRVIADDQSTIARAIDIGTIADIAANLVADHEELFNDMETVIGAIEHRLFEQPEPGMALPESVWFELVSELAAERDSFTSNDAWKLASVANKLRGYAPASPEVTGALRQLEGFSERHGARLYDQRPSRKVAFTWMPGRGPTNRAEASSHH